MSGDLRGLLDSRFQEAADAMAKKIESELLYGRSEASTMQPLTINDINSLAQRYYVKPTWDQVVVHPTAYEALKKRATNKENNMDTADAVSLARSEAKKAKAKELLAHIEGELGQYDLVAGTFITARVEFDNSDKVYHYAWIRGDKSWYRTYSTKTYSTEDLVDELVQLIIDANTVEWEIVGVEQ